MLDQQKTVLGVFLEIEGAFNNTCYGTMCDVLVMHGSEYTIIRWFRANLEGRVAVANLNGFSMRLAISRGCPQGGVLSSRVWCLVVDDLLARLSGNGVFIQGNAEDRCLLAVGKFPNMVSGLMHWALSTLETWWNEVKLLVNPDKTGHVAFTRKRNSWVSVNHNYFEVKLSPSRPVKYLGVILDSRLTWRKHVDVKMRKAHNLLWACRRACRARWA